ncbi:MAG TPA: hypothetical protein VFU81_10630, partial [Thermomicrobiales bacterium]|nr:hypothetical protein [Thermomicrobiales bacterium]
MTQQRLRPIDLAEPQDGIPEFGKRRGDAEAISAPSICGQRLLVKRHSALMVAEPARHHAGDPQR